MNIPVTIKRRIGVIACLACVLYMLPGCLSHEDAASLGIMTFNIRYDNPGDGDHRWELRKDWVAEIILTEAPDVVGLQEALRAQIDTLAVKLPLYRWTGVGRADGLNRGEFSPIFFRADRLVLQDGGTFWLSLDPDSVGSMGWDAALPRIVTWAEFLDLKTRLIIFVFNTHFDHRGALARVESASLVRRRIRQIAGDSPSILTGDFNDLDTSPMYEDLTADEGDGITLSDSRVAAISDSLATFRGFEAGSVEPRRIDYVFLSQHFRTRSHRVLDDDRNGSYPSDHLPVFVVISSPTSERRLLEQ